MRAKRNRTKGITGKLGIGSSVMTGLKHAEVFVSKFAAGPCWYIQQYAAPDFQTRVFRGCEGMAALEL